MQLFEIEVLERSGSWLIQLNGKVVSGAASRTRAQTIARHAAASLRTAGFPVTVDGWLAST